MLSMKLWVRFRSFSVLSKINQDNEFAKDKCQSCQPVAKYSILQPKDSKFDKVLNLYYQTGSYYSFSRNERPELLRQKIVFNQVSFRSGVFRHLKLGLKLKQNQFGVK